MRELVYLSTAKLNALAPKPGQSVFTGSEIEVSLWGLRFKTATAPLESAPPWRRLGRAEKQLSKQARDFDTEPVPRPGAWVGFDTELSAEAPVSWLDGLDIALFAGERVGESGVVTALLLCGSGRHLASRAGAGGSSDGGGGSAPNGDWFKPPGELRQEGSVEWRDLDRRRREAAPDAGVDASVDAALAAPAAADQDLQPGAAGLWTGYALHRAVRQRAISPPVPMRGYARVLMAGDVRPPDTSRPVRIVLATPLAVEYSVAD